MFNCRGWFVSPCTLASDNYLSSYAYDAAYVMDDNNCATVLVRFVNALLLQVAQVNTKKVSGLDNLVLAKKWGISPKKALNTIHCTTQHGIHTVLHPPLSRHFRTNDHHL